MREIHELKHDCEANVLRLHCGCSEHGSRTSVTVSVESVGFRNITLEHASLVLLSLNGQETDGLT